MKISAMLEVLLASGVEHDVIVKAVAALEASETSENSDGHRLSPADVRAERNRRYYQNRKARASETSENSDATPAPSPASPAPQKKGLPHTPSKENSPLSSPPTTPTPIAIEGELEPKPSKRGSRLPQDWLLPSSWGRWAMQECGMSDRDVRYQADVFRDYWVAQPGQKGLKLDWEATWRNWCRRKLTSPTGGNIQNPQQPRGVAALAADLRKRIAENDEERSAGQGGQATGTVLGFPELRR